VILRPSNLYIRHRRLQTVSSDDQWLANPFLFLSWISFEKYKKASLLLSILATITGLSFLSFDQIMTTEAGHYSNIIEYKLGYWLWISSMVIILLGNILRQVNERTNLLIDI